METTQKLRVLVLLKNIFKERFNLDEDKADELQTIAAIKKGVEFKGTNLWVLIFAIMIASVGLNVNSTAVIIGAMLISPLMGPIMGIGLGVGINDLMLIKSSFKNLGIAVLISVLTSTLYFLVSPLGEAQSELLARTTPTIWDVLIALFGGLAGIVAVSRKSVSTVIPGVAIATALMPPLCTAGYGLAEGNFSYFFGAFFLFFINSVFISLSTLLIVRFLRYPQNEYSNKAFGKKVKIYIFVIVGLTVVPSLFMGYAIVERSIFTRNANQFLINELSVGSVFIVGKNLSIEKGEKRIEVFTIGEIDNEKIVTVRSKLKYYNLEGAKLIIKQSDTKDKKLDMSAIRKGLIEDLYKKNEEILKTKDQKIALLESELQKTGYNQFPINNLYEEAKAQHSKLIELFVTKTVLATVNEKRLDTINVVFAKFKNRPGWREQKRFLNWIEKRTKSENIKLIIE
ncbi:MAG: TIGR00341 family protein [Ignavibacteria bacterium]|nr:TIGR00341 family protein [Ignavibacteria bacterium]